MSPGGSDGGWWPDVTGWRRLLTRRRVAAKMPPAAMGNSAKAASRVDKPHDQASRRPTVCECGYWPILGNNWVILPNTGIRGGRLALRGLLEMAPRACTWHCATSSRWLRGLARRCLRRMKPSRASTATKPIAGDFEMSLRGASISGFRCVWRAPRFGEAEVLGAGVDFVALFEQVIAGACRAPRPAGRAGKA